MDNDNPAQLEELLGYKFRDTALLKTALTHSSFVDNRLFSNERLEFLGDSILGLVICLNLYKHFPHYFEGDLTKLKSSLVSRKTCAEIANGIGIPQYTSLGKGMSRTRAVSGSIAAGTFEAIIAAIYLDSDFDTVAKFVMKLFEPLIEDLDASRHHENFKSMLQQYAQQHYDSTPFYELLDEKGPDHNKCFEIQVVLGLRRFPSAWGITKKDTEQKAAKNALVNLGILSPEQQE